MNLDSFTVRVFGEPWSITGAVGSYTYLQFFDAGAGVIGEALSI
jgi:hypothetical protein